RISGDVDFSGAEFKGHLYLQSAAVQGGVYLRPAGDRRAVVRGDVWMDSAHVGADVELTGAEVLGRLVLGKAGVGGGLCCTAAPPTPGATERMPCHVAKEVSFRSLDAAGLVNLSGLKADDYVFGARATIRGNLVCRGDDKQPREVARGL